jgi:acetate kinase
MNVLVLNCGSSSVKFQLIATDLERIESDTDQHLASGIVDRIGGKSQLTFRVEGRIALRESKPQRDHKAAIESIVSWVISDGSGIAGIGSMADIHAVGHRVVHGGEKFQASTLVTPEVEEGIRDCINLAPLHNPANLKGIEAVRRLMGSGVPQTAVFDTAFHSTMPPESYLYAVPYQLYRRHGIRRYGFHGTSHRYVAYRYRKLAGLGKEQVRIISLHLGNGCSACAIAEGKSLDTSMGMTPLEGLVMGTRCGDIDPSLVEYLCEVEGYTVGEADTFLNRNSGLLGISGLTADMRDLLEEREATGDRRATLAVDIFCNRVRKYIGAYLAQLGGAQAICFAGGIGENSAAVRAQICRGLEVFGLELDGAANGRKIQDSRGWRISTESSRLHAYVIATDEELLIARDTVRAIQAL